MSCSFDFVGETRTTIGKMLRALIRYGKKENEKYNVVIIALPSYLKNNIPFVLNIYLFPLHSLPTPVIKYLTFFPRMEDM